MSNKKQRFPVMQIPLEFYDMPNKQENIILDKKTSDFKLKLIEEKGERTYKLHSNLMGCRDNSGILRYYIIAEHNECGYTWNIEKNNLLKTNCPYCSLKAHKTTRGFSWQVNFISEGLCKLKSEYLSDDKNVYMECMLCNRIFPRTPSDFLQYHEFCPYCKVRSRGELAILKYLEKKNIFHEVQYKIQQCKNTNVLPFDFAIFDENGKILALIEFDGKQHFSKKAWKGFSLKEQRKRDIIKTKYCRKNNIPFLRIHYTQLNIINEILDDFLENMNTYIGMNNFYGMTEKEYYA